ncbi:hypothetical protein PTSG_00960 [Salpingoeca rosetta]|uniref:Kinesin motor domain-containing protein n=1 Tax=Salpingoeca rosetta (strain ATCC 50818 / BSB-021) TaxID=946362 RepID=F2TXZ8_SALR5|nr:uncharacterized protein PTSG_00960 [Salpingoeca rosetta]EGD76257.1 hypothetical protein PTSG_00960 [Salpingoeca rosetta]|eukprot:XP_004998432.1 hypothetical protein PTSG_00960 [Salpingoeca rosetta]
MGQDLSQLHEVGAMRQVLERCSWEQRFKLLSLNRSYHALTFEQETWQIFCHLLETQDFVHVQRRKDEDWRDAFFRHLPLRKRWHGTASRTTTPADEERQRQQDEEAAAPRNAVDTDVLGGTGIDNGREENTPDPAASHFTINVCARFRPLPKHVDAAVARAATNGDGDTDDDDGTDAAAEEDVHGERATHAVVPLHQRIRMIQAHYGCSTSEARKLLWAGKGDVSAWDPWTDAQARAPARRLPLSDINGDSSRKERAKSKSQAPTAQQEQAPAVEQREGHNGKDDGTDGAHNTSDSAACTSTTTTTTTTTATTPAASSSSSSSTSAADTATTTDAAATDTSEPKAHALPTSVRTGVLAIRPDTNDLVLCAAGGLRHFEFDSVLPDTFNQDDLYDRAARLQVGQFLNGVNACVLCYGQTGSGKTYSMFGPDDVTSTKLSRLSSQAGIAPRAITEVANTVMKRREHGLEVSLKLTCVEIFGQDITDLLHERSVVGAWHGVAARAVLNNEAAEEIVDPYELDELLLRAERSKRRAATAMNERSSRAHTVFLLSLDQRNPRTHTRLQSTLCLADLGGSEQLKKSKAEGERKQEAAKINLGLLALKRCIGALQSNDPSHVPFGDSTLTMLLRPALSGNSFTTVVVTGSMESRHVFETMQTMRFGEACQAVTGSEVTANVNAATQAIDAINKEITDLEQRIRSEERWVNKTTVRKDQEGEETVVTSVLVGAEELRERYEQLLETRRELLGI